MDTIESTSQSIEIYFMTDQPSTCPHCWTRCDWLGNFYHTNAKRIVMKCLNDDCGFLFFEDEDEEILKLWCMI